MTADVALLPRRARRAVRTPRSSARCCRSRRTRSIRIAAWRRTSTSPRRARARCTRWRPGTARLVVASAAALLPRLSAPERLRRRRARRSRPGTTSRRPTSADLLVDAGFTRAGSGRRARRVLRARRHRRLLSRRRRAAGPPRVHRRHDRVDPHLRPGDAALDRRRSIRRRSCRCTELLGDPDDADRSATVFDYLWRGRPAAGVVSEPDEVAGARREDSASRSSASYDEARARRAQRAAPPAALIARLGRRARRWLEPATRARDAGARRRRQTAVAHRVPAGDGVPRPRARLGRRDPRGARARRDDRVRRRTPRAAPSGRSSCSQDYDVFAVPVERAEDARYAAVLVGDRPAVARLPPAGRRPADLRRDRRLRGGAARARAAPLRDARRSSPTSAT